MLMRSAGSDVPPAATGVLAVDATGFVDAGSVRPRSKYCRSARIAAIYYRLRTHTWQELRSAPRLADRTPIVAGKSCHWARYAAGVWSDRSAAARRAYYRWLRTVGHIVALLERGLEGSPMEGTGAILEREGRRRGVSPYFIVAVAATESSIGRAACGPGGFNAWGLGNCGTAWTVPAFRSWAEAIAYYADFLADRWPGHSTPYSFNGYAACDDCWARKVSQWMWALFNVSPRTAYP